MNIEVTSANKSVLDSGTVIIFDNSADLSFDIKMDDSFSFSLILKFEKKDGEKYELKPSFSNNTITLTCVNFDNVLGTGTSTPIELATFNGKKVYINFWVNALGSNSLKEITYTFYSER